MTDEIDDTEVEAAEVFIPEPDNAICYYIAQEQTTHDEKRRMISLITAVESDTPPDKLVWVARQVELFLSGDLARMEAYAESGDAKTIPFRKPN